MSRPFCDPSDELVVPTYWTSVPYALHWYRTAFVSAASHVPVRHSYRTAHGTLPSASTERVVPHAPFGTALRPAPDESAVIRPCTTSASFRMVCRPEEAGQTGV
eukprot:1477515-Rhodomonas_salina.2